MTHSPVDVPPFAHVKSHPGPDSVGPVPFNRRALQAGTAIASAIRGALSLAPASAFVAPPVDGRPVPASVVPDGPPSVGDRLRRVVGIGRNRGDAPEQAPARPPRLMPGDTGRHVNAMPAHAMAAGGRPLMMKIPGR